MISFHSVSFHYPAVASLALDSVSLHVQDGELLAIVGANGSGKSTLGRLANALLQPRSGTVTVDGVATESPEGVAFARQQVGMVFQNPDASIVSATVEEDVAFALENRALPRPEMAERVGQTLALLGLTPYRQNHPLELTTSNRARLGLAAAVVGEPRYLIMDEATAYLDAGDRASLLAAVADLRAATGMAVVLITHVMDEALTADRVVVLAEGQLVFTGTPQALFADPSQARAWRLELPPLLQFHEELRSRGMAVRSDPLTIAATVEQVWPL